MIFLQLIRFSVSVMLTFYKEIFVRIDLWRKSCNQSRSANATYNLTNLFFSILTLLVFVNERKLSIFIQFVPHFQRINVLEIWMILSKILTPLPIFLQVLSILTWVVGSTLYPNGIDVCALLPIVLWINYINLSSFTVTFQRTILMHCAYFIKMSQIISSLKCTDESVHLNIVN